MFLQIPKNEKTHPAVGINSALIFFDWRTATLNRALVEENSTDSGSDYYRSHGQHLIRETCLRKKWSLGHRSSPGFPRAGTKLMVGGLAGCSESEPSYFKFLEEFVPLWVLNAELIQSGEGYYHWWRHRIEATSEFMEIRIGQHVRKAWYWKSGTA